MKTSGLPLFVFLRPKMMQYSELKILLVEDNPGDALLIREALKESIYRSATLIEAGCVADAKTFAQENIVLLLLDLGLPDSNGLETITQIQEYFPDSALIILTGLDDDKVAIEALRQGAQNYLTKDEINEKVLSRTIRFSLERHEIRQELKATEKRLTDAQSVAKVGNWETDLSTLEMIWSLEIYRIFELDPSNFRATHPSFLNFVYSEDKPLVDAAFNGSYKNMEFNSIEHRIITGRGNQKWVEEKWKAFQDDRGNPIKAFGTCQDITKRKLAEIENALLISNTEESFVLLDNDLNIVSFNNQFYSLYQYYFKVIIEKGKSIFDYARPGRRETLKNIYTNVLAGNAQESEIDFSLPDNSKRVFSIKYKPAKSEADGVIGVFVTCRDITASKQAGDQIQAEKFFSDSLINSLPGIFYLFDQDGRFSRWNKNFETISGYDADEISGMHPLDFFDEDEKLLLLAKIGKVFMGGEDEFTAHLYTKDKQKKPYYFTGHKIVISGNSYLIGVGIDVAERIKAERELIRYTDEIKRLTVHLEKVREDERTRIAREVHDELGQQLTGLKMDASWLSKKISKEEKALHGKLSGMISLMDDTVKTIRRISTDLRPGILDDLGLVAALEWQCDEFSKSSEVKCSITSEVHDINFERNLATTIFRIFQESLTNVARHANASRIEASLTQTDNEIILIIADNGGGFDVAQAKVKGTLGLIGMRERAFMAGAQLQIVSEKGLGTRVILKIPVALVVATP